MSKKTLVGVFLIGGALLFAAGLFLIGSRKQVFAHHFEVYTEFNKVDTLQPGAKVRVSGMDAGQNRRYTDPYDTGFAISVEIAG